MPYIKNNAIYYKKKVMPYTDTVDLKTKEEFLFSLKLFYQNKRYITA